MPSLVGGGMNVARAATAENSEDALRLAMRIKRYYVRDMEPCSDDQDVKECRAAIEIFLKDCLRRNRRVKP